MDKIEIEINSFFGKKFIAKMVDTFKSLFPPAFETEDYLIINLPFGKAICSYLNTGLTIGLLEFDANAPTIVAKFLGDNNEIPYKIGFCLKGAYFLDYKYENIHEEINQGQSVITTPRDESVMSTKPNTANSILHIFISQNFLNNYFNIKSKYLNQAIK